LLRNAVAAMNSLQTYINRIWRHWWLVLVITVVATVGALLYTVAQPTTYTARSTLTTASENRSPDQDAYLAEGYAQYFNKESYQQRIRTLVQVPEDIEVTALTGATSPILYIEATGPDPAVASRVVAQVAQRFAGDVQGGATASRDEEIARIDRRIKDMQALLNRAKGENDQRALILSEIFDLQRRANDLRDSTTNQLIDLQRDAGVSAQEPSLIFNGLLGFAGGLALGCAAALALTVLRNRITTPDDVRRLLGLPTLAVLDEPRRRRRDDKARAERLESLAAVVSLADLPRPATLTITAPRRTSLTTQVAEGIVYYEALQGTRTLLVRADLRGAGTDAANQETTVAGLLGGISARPLAPMEIAIGTAELLVVPAGMPLTSDPFALFAPARFDALLRNLSGLADLIVIEAPPVNEAAESQIICAVADQTVLVVEERKTRGSDGSRACELLTQVGASMLGAVLGRPARKNGHAEPFSIMRDLLAESGGANEEDASPQARVSPPPWTDETDSAPPVPLAESTVAATPESTSTASDVIDAPFIRSEADPSSSAELAERHVEIPEQVVQVNDDVMGKIIDIDLDHRRILLSPKQANEGVDAIADDFDPTLYGMAASYDEQGNYLYPEGFDPETGEWLEGYEEQRAAWEQQYAQAHARWEAHKRQVEDANGAAAPGSEDHWGGQDDEAPDTEPVAALKDNEEQIPGVEEAFDIPATAPIGDPALQPQPIRGAPTTEYVLYSDTLMAPTVSPKTFDPQDPKFFLPHQVPDAQAAMPPPVAPDLDTPPTLTAASPLVPALLSSACLSARLTESMILAIECPHGHSNRPTAANCRVCGAVIPPQRPRLVSRPVLGVLRANDGTSAEVDRAIIVGRAPDPSRSAFKAPRLMRLDSSGNDISRTHVEVAPEGWQVIATDLDSTSGTVLVYPGGHERQELTPGEPVPVQPGSVLELGDGVSITVGLPS
jgi:Mrp family chromosome partitioning ATPase/capsular polysaccharide biosynthesis protein